MFARMFFYPLFHHGAQKIWNPGKSLFGFFIPRHRALFRRIKRNFNLLAALRRIETPLVLVQPITMIDVGTCATAAADVGVFAVATFTFQVRIAEGIEDIS